MTTEADLIKRARETAEAICQRCAAPPRSDRVSEPVVEPVVEFRPRRPVPTSAR